jgi:hypothetical protein
MKSKAAILLGLIVFLGFETRDTHTSASILAAVARAYAAGPLEETPAIKERIQRVENGLLLPSLKAGPLP